VEALQAYFKTGSVPTGGMHFDPETSVGDNCSMPSGICIVDFDTVIHDVIIQSVYYRANVSGEPTFEFLKLRP
jgi:hypothetical protein